LHRSSNHAIFCAVADRTPLTKLQHAFLALYLFGAGGLATLAIQPELLPDTAPASHDSSLRGVLVGASVLMASMYVGALLRKRWVRPLALFLHGLVALIALVGLVSLLLGSPLFDGDTAELGGKFAVHALMTAAWASRWLRTPFAR
jgi:hypothetical protein